MNLAEALPIEQARVRELVTIFCEIPQGILAATMMRQSLAQAEKAAATGDVVAMIHAYEDLKRYSA